MQVENTDERACDKYCELHASSPTVYLTERRGQQTAHSSVADASAEVENIISKVEIIDIDSSDGSSASDDELVVTAAANTIETYGLSIYKFPTESGIYYVEDDIVIIPDDANYTASTIEVELIAKKNIILIERHSEDKLGRTMHVHNYREGERITLNNNASIDSANNANKGFKVAKTKIWSN